MRIMPGRGQWSVCYASRQSFIITFFDSLPKQLLSYLYWLSVQTFQPQILIYRRDNNIIGDVHRFISHCLIPAIMPTNSTETKKHLRFWQVLGLNHRV